LSLKFKYSMLKNIQNFFLDLQQSDEATKKRWLVILTSGSMLAVVGLWSVYINLTVENLVEKNQNQGPSFLETFKNGLAVLSKEAGSKTSQLMANLQAATSRTNSITIQPENFNAVLKDLEEIKPKKLP